MNKFVIEARLPSLNEYVNACRRNKYAGAKFKKDTEETIGLFIQVAKGKGWLTPVHNYPCEVNIEWHERTKKRDADNIQSSQKFILDALQRLEIIETDGRRCISQVNHKIINDSKDFVIVELIERK